MSMTLATKVVVCQCGHTFEAAKVKSWCQKCCRPVFYYQKDQRKHQFNSYYIMTLLVMVLLFMGYLFVKLVAGPLLSL